MNRLATTFLAVIAVSSTVFGQESKRPAATNLEILRELEYGRAGDRSLKLDLIRPKSPPEKSLPVVVFVHGGGWQSGSKDQGQVILQALVQSGHYVGISVGYRLSGEAHWPAQIHDCKAAIRWIRANATKYEMNPDRIGVWGVSAGGHLVSLLGTSGGVEELEGSCGNPGQSSRVTCVVSYCGPTNLRTLWRDGNPNSTLGRLFGGSGAEKKDAAIQASPVTHITSDDPPFLIVHGTRDPLVPLQQAETMAAALKDQGVPVTYLKIDGGYHVAGLFQPEALKRVQAFFDKHLRGIDRKVSAEPIRYDGPPEGARPAKAKKA